MRSHRSGRADRDLKRNETWSKFARGSQKLWLEAKKKNHLKRFKRLGHKKGGKSKNVLIHFKDNPTDRVGSGKRKRKKSGKKGRCMEVESCVWGRKGERNGISFTLTPFLPRGTFVRTQLHLGGQLGPVYAKAKKFLTNRSKRLS